MPPIRKYDSGSKKRKRNAIREELARSQRGALNKFIVRGTPPPLEDDNEILATLVHDCANINDDGDDFNSDDKVNDDNVDVTNCEAYVINSHETQNHDYENCDNIDVNDANDDDANDDGTNVDDDNTDDAILRLDIFDPRRWDDLDSKMIDVLVVNSPKRDLSIHKGPKDKYFRRFSATFYTRILSNGEVCDRDWLVYSKELDKLFCFCCKIFRKGCVIGQLVNEGFNDWGYLGIRLKEHETSAEHIKNMTTWYDLRHRVQTFQTIDKVAQKQLEKEKDHWKKVLIRIVCVVKYLARRNLAFRGTNARLYQNSNGNFLGLIEMLAEFDPVIQEHIQRIHNDDIQFHYLGPRIQNELILFLGTTIKREIIRKIKEAKYFSVILDCTPDTSHQEQMSLMLRYVDISSNSISIEESFLGFLDVNDTMGQGLFDVLQKELKSLDLDIDDVRGQGYDNGSNMKGKHQGVQKKILDINPRAFYTPCGCHSLNLLLCDMANTCRKARDFFGVIQRIYTIFANSTKRWQILKDNVEGLTLKSLSSTRWESRIDSVKAIRFQISEIQEALLQVGDNDNDSKIKSEAKSLAQNELGDFEFLMAIVIWYEILSAVNLVSKQLQSKDMLIDVAIQQVKALISYFEGYRETGFLNALECAKNIAAEMNIDSVFPQKREIRRKKQFDENPNERPSQSAEESFRVDYFLCVVDHAITLLRRRFEQYQEYENIFGFLFSYDKLCSLDDTTLKSSCIHLECALKKGDVIDIDGNELFVELKLFQEFLPREMMGPIDILRSLKRINCFPNAIVAYRILLTIPVTVASAKRSFSKLKLLKSYLRSTMTQERLNGLALVAIESDLLEKVDYENLIEDFVSENVKRVTLFK